MPNHLMKWARLNVFVLRHNYSNHADMEFVKELSSQAGSEEYGNRDQ
jgi:hypothetical protein